MKALAYSYIRFSSPEQAKGHSLERQTEAAALWCRRHGVHLDGSTTFRDLGKSGFTGEHRKNPDRHALAAFLKLVEQGRIPKGSYLIIENLDRLTREDERAALRLWMDILDAGINIVQLNPETTFRHEKSDMFDIMRAIMELSRGHGESLRKSTTMGPIWAKKKKQAREKVVTPVLPAWVRLRGDKLELIPERAAIVKKIFQLARTQGSYSLVRRLTDEGVPAWGRSRVWNRNYIYSILTDRRAVGEYQPMKGRRGHRRPDGDPVPGYYPAVVTEEDYLAAQGVMADRKNRRGRLGAADRINLFSGLVRDLEGDPYQVASRTGGSRVLMTIHAREGRERSAGGCFPLAVFERAILSQLKELDPAELIGGNGETTELVNLGRERDGLKARIDELTELLEGDNLAPVVKKLREMDLRLGELNTRIRELEQEAAAPLPDAWGEAKSILGYLDKAADPTDARLRLRAALRRIVESIRLRVVPCGIDRLALVDIWFAGGEACRTYHIFYRRTVGTRNERVIKGGWCCTSSAWSLKDFDFTEEDWRKALEKAQEYSDEELEAQNDALPYQPGPEDELLEWHESVRHDPKTWNPLPE
jgi:DNA invertase Pin-like site-specific DNA recombinase